MKRVLLALGALLMAMDIAPAQPYPSRPIIMVVPFGAGGKLAGLGQDIPPPEMQTSEALGQFYQAEIDKWWPVIREAGIKVE